MHYKLILLLVFALNSLCDDRVFGELLDLDNVYRQELYFSLDNALYAQNIENKKVYNLQLQGNFILNILPEQSESEKEVQGFFKTSIQRIALWLKTSIQNIVDWLFSEIIDWQFKNYTKLPGSLIKLQNLQRLELSDHKGLDIHHAISILAQLPELQVLSLTDISIQSLPTSISNLKQLKELYIKGARLKALPNSIGQLPNLQRLSLGGVDTNQEDWSYERIENILTPLASSKNLDDLTITFINFLPNSAEPTSEIKLNKNIQEISSLTSLRIAYTNLTQVPVELFNLSELISLDLSNNQIKQLPSQIEQLQKLQWINLAKNKLSHLPIEAFKNMANLDYLILSNNQFSTKEIEQIEQELSHLEVIY